MSLAFKKANSDTLDKLRAQLPSSQRNENMRELSACSWFCFLKGCIGLNLMFVADAHETHWVRKEMFGGWNKGERCGEDMEWHWELMQEEGKRRKTSPF